MSEAGQPALIGQIVRQAQGNLSQSVWDYLVGGAGSEATVLRNKRAFEAIGWRRRVLRDVQAPDTSVSILGERLRIPVFLSPIGSLGLLHADGVLASARAADAFGTTLFYGVNSEVAVQNVVAHSRSRLVFQLYLRAGRSWWEPLLAEIRRLGFRALCITVDVPVVGRRERDIRNGYFALNATDAPRPNLALAGTSPDPARAHPVDWEVVREVIQASGLPVLIKGIQTPEDALLALEAGAAGIYVSNHGGRQLDDEPATIEVLPDIVAAVQQRVPVLLDGGITKGADVVKAVALGAAAVGIGKLHGWALAAGGEAMVVRLLEILEQEIVDTLQQIGVASLAQLDAGVLRDLPHLPGASSWIPD